jgi:hypothetical protein
MSLNWCLRFTPSHVQESASSHGVQAARACALMQVVSQVNKYVALCLASSDRTGPSLTDLEEWDKGLEFNSRVV